MKTLLSRVTAAALLTCALTFAAFAQTPRVIEFEEEVLTVSELDGDLLFTLRCTPPLKGASASK